MQLLSFVSLVPGILAVIFLLLNVFGINSAFEQLAISTPFLIGLLSISVIWYVYLTGYRYSRLIVMAHGITSLVFSATILCLLLADADFPYRTFLIPEHMEPYAVNFSALFVGYFVVQVLIFWLPRTKHVINIVLAVILFVELLSSFGKVYNLGDAASGVVLLPMPVGALAGLLVINLAVFSYVNRMERLYLSQSIVLSFLAMLVAVIGANIAVYGNIGRTISVSIDVDRARPILVDVYNLNLAVDRVAAQAKSYSLGGSPQDLEAYHQEKQAYADALQRLRADAEGWGGEHLQNSVRTMSDVGQKIMTASEAAVSQRQAGGAGAVPADDRLDEYSSQFGVAAQGVAKTYADALDRYSRQQAVLGRNIVLGVSATSSLTILLIVFTPLFVRQAIRRLSVTQEKLGQTVKLLSEETTRAEAILSSIGDGLYAIDTAGRITLFNDMAEKLTGFKKEEVFGKDFDEVMRFMAADGQPAPAFVALALEGKESHINHNLLLVRSRGRKVDVQLSAAPIKDMEGKVLGVIVVFRDRTSEQALENSKDEFMSLASHQLRTPATATKQFLAMFLQGYAGKVDDRQRLYLQQAYDNNEMGITIIEELLNITRLENGRLKLSKKELELTEFVRKQVALHQERARAANQRLVVQVPETPITVMADPILLGMALDNLITNAVKYSLEGGKTTVKVLRGKGVVRIGVSDSGIGIKREDLPKIFERFSRLEDPQKNVGGTGLGLYLVRRVMHMHHGKVRVDSTYGKGSSFVLEFKM